MKKEFMETQGKAMCASLYKVLVSFCDPAFNENVSQEMFDEISNSIENAMVGIASLCCGSDSWSAMCDFLESSGVHLPESFRQNRKQ